MKSLTHALIDEYGEKMNVTIANSGMELPVPYKYGVIGDVRVYYGLVVGFLIKEVLRIESELNVNFNSTQRFVTLDTFNALVLDKSALHYTRRYYANETNYQKRWQDDYDYILERLEGDTNPYTAQTIEHNGVEYLNFKDVLVLTSVYGVLE